MPDRDLQDLSPQPLRRLPDATECYVPGVGEVTLGQVRRDLPPPDEDVDPDAATVRMWVHICTRAPRAEPWKARNAPAM